MNFWNDLKRIRDGEESSFHIQLDSFFGEEEGYGSAINVRAGYSPNEIFLMPASKYLPTRALDSGCASVYWLPWEDMEMVKVMFRDLNASPCSYFMTAEFSGCRFVITDEYLAHIAFSVDYHNPQTTLEQFSADRTECEAETRGFLNLGAPALYRSLSSSNLPYSKASGFGAKNFQKLSYFQKGGAIDDNRMILFGYRDPLSVIGWSFKYLLFQKNRNRPPIWHVVPIPNRLQLESNPFGPIPQVPRRPANWRSGYPPLIPPRKFK